MRGLATPAAKRGRLSGRPGVVQAMILSLPAGLGEHQREL